MLVEKEIIAPGIYWYVDEKTGVPRKLEVTPALTKYWHEQGSKMLSFGMPVPVPYEHDFDQHPMTPKDKLLNNAGEVKEYRLRDNVLFGVVDVKDSEVKKKINDGSIKWTSPWINSFTDGDGRQWSNVISHLALTTRPRITKQTPFPSIAAALSLATEVKPSDTPKEGFCLSGAGRLVKNKRTSRLRPLYPMAFSLLGGGIKFAEDDDVRPLKKKDKSDSDKSGSDSSSSKPKPKSDSKPGSSSGSKPPSKPKGDEGGGESSGSDDDLEGEDFESGDDIFTSDDDFGGEGISTPGSSLSPLGSSGGDVRMEEILCDLLNALGVFMPENVGEAEFKRALYEAAMGKIRELTSKAQMQAQANDPTSPQNMAAQPPKPAPMGAGSNQPNPLVQQEQQPMYMSLEDINKISDPTMRGIALAMHEENAKLLAKLDSAEKVTHSLRDAKLKEATAARDTKIALLGKMSPRAKADLEAMKALPSMALSLGDGGEVVDPMAATINLLEKSLTDIPRLLTTDAASLSVQAQPTDGEMSQEQVDSVADSYARMMGAAPDQKKAS